MVVKICKPLFDRVLIQVTQQNTQESKTGIIVPKDKKEEMTLSGVIVAVGEGRLNDTGDKRIPLSVEVGDRVFFSKYGFDEIEIEGQSYLIGREDQILAVLEKINTNI